MSTGGSPNSPELSTWKRVVTIYKTETPEGWAGGALTTLERSTSTKVVAAIITSVETEGNDVVPTSTPSVAEETTAKQTADTTSAKVTATSSKDNDNSLPTAIIASTATGSDTAGALAMATETPASVNSVLSTLAAESTVASSTGASAASAIVASSAISAASAASATQSASSTSTGSTTGTKAGIAIGVLAGIFVVLAMVYLIIRKRKKQLQEEGTADNEKLGAPLEGAATVPPATPAKAPRLSLRPMTQLFMGASVAADKQVSKVSEKSLDMVDSPTMKPPPGADAWERPMTSDSQNVYNPFGAHAETIMEEPATPRNPASPMTPNSEMSTQMPSPTWAAGLSPAPRASATTTDSAVPVPTVNISPPDSPAHSSSQSVPRGPTVDANVSPLQVNAPQTNTVGQAITTPTASEAAAGVAVTGLQRKQSVRRDNAPEPLDLTLPPKMTIVPPSPTGTEFSLQEAESGQSPNQSSAGAAAIAAAGGPANSNVHRVQLDFKPTMDDELELHAGQVVRLLHEYDDGWSPLRVGPKVLRRVANVAQVRSIRQIVGPWVLQVFFRTRSGLLGDRGDLDHSLPPCNVLNHLPVSDRNLPAYKVDLDGLSPLLA
ncbi:hypothetical protein VPNG_06070 [Cytospora leucostoma]|uniref:SH3 domain-containing protein n=1 Tax=Cytospora leucostoma TaxID=1230097 RepID=A0A423WX74_9PEZI|nr:hypothetical protein VPNG_06070 [Cytospora leucostoma]